MHDDDMERRPPPEPAELGFHLDAEDDEPMTVWECVVDSVMEDDLLRRVVVLTICAVVLLWALGQFDPF